MRRKKKSDWLRFFEDGHEGTDRHVSVDEGDENLTLQQSIRLFVRNFPHQSARYKIVWGVRILCWILLCLVALFGTAVRVRKYFG